MTDASVAAPSAQDLEVTAELVEFIRQSPSMFHAVATARCMLDGAGFSYLPEGEPWRMGLGGAYYTVRNGSSLVAWRVGRRLDDYHFQIAAAHTDSPTFKVKAVPELAGPREYLRLDVEGYGGMIDSTWFDRPLGVAGRAIVRDGDRLESRLVNIQKDVMLFPNVAIHFNRRVNEGYAYNKQVDLCPLFSAGALHAGAFDAMVAEAAGVEPSQLVARDMYLANHQPASIWGWRDEFVSAPKLDDLQCAFAALKALVASGCEGHVSVCALFDNEEVGSGSMQGAKSTFLRDVLERISSALGKTADEYRRAVARSFLVSCDNAHAVHPNHPEKTDEVNAPQLNRGVVVKEAANQKYTTDAFSRAVFCELCRRAGVPVQAFANRSDSAGGSTLGNLSAAQVSLHAVDVGLPQLAMHSAYETAGTRDTAWGIRALSAFFETDVRLGDGESVALG